MTQDHLKAAAEKYDEKMRKTDPEMNGLSMREESFLAGAELMRAENERLRKDPSKDEWAEMVILNEHLREKITELERKLGILSDALVRVHNHAGVTYGWQVLIDQALASIQAEGKEESVG